ncbi:MAG: hypothetical protein R3B70_31915 [Polyangiaceae bacterium]
MEDQPEQSPEDVKKAVEAVYAYGASLLRAGKTSAEVEEALIEKGIPQETAALVVSRLVKAREEIVVEASNKNKSQGQTNMALGALICIAGIVITAATYSAASEGGGRYVVAWGAIIFGAIRFFRGLSQASG